MSPICYPNLTFGTFLRSNLSDVNPLIGWLAFGKLPENPIVTPNTTTQVIVPSGENRFLQSVTVNPIPTTPGA
jgi:hypothetical protein